MHMRRHVDWCQYVAAGACSDKAVAVWKKSQAGAAFCVYDSVIRWHHVNKVIWTPSIMLEKCSFVGKSDCSAMGAYLLVGA